MPKWKWTKDGLTFGKEVFSEFQKDECPAMAASLAYYTIFSLAPMLVIVMVVAAYFVTPEQAGDAVNGQFSGLVGADGASQIELMVEHVRASPEGSVIAQILGVVAVLFGGSGAMIQLQSAMNRAWNVTPDPKRGGVKSFVMKRVLSFAMILTISFLLLVSLLLTAILSAASTGVANLLPSGVAVVSASILNFVSSLLLTSALFAAIFKLMPDARIRWRDVAVGGLVTGALFTIGKALIGAYLGNSSVGSAYGAASSLAIVLVWVYYSSIILMFGAEFTQVWTRRYGGGMTPMRGATIADPNEESHPPLST